MCRLVGAGYCVCFRCCRGAILHEGNHGASSISGYTEVRSEDAQRSRVVTDTQLGMVQNMKSGVIAHG